MAGLIREGAYLRGGLFEGGGGYLRALGLI